MASQTPGGSSVAVDISTLLLPDVQPVANTVDEEIVAIRAHLQHAAVVHNQLVKATLEQFQDQRAAIDKAAVDGQDLAGQLVGINAEAYNMQKIVVAHNKDMDERMVKLVQSADDATIQASFRLSKIENYFAQFDPDNPKLKDVDARLAAAEVTLKGLNEGFNQQVDNLVSARLNRDLEPKLKGLIADGVRSEQKDIDNKLNEVITETAKLGQTSAVQAQSLEAQRVSGQDLVNSTRDLVNRVSVLDGQVASLSGIAARSAPVREPPGMEQSSSPAWDTWQPAAAARGLPMPAAPQTPTAAPAGASQYHIGTPATPAGPTHSSMPGHGVPYGRTGGGRSDEAMKITVTSRIFEEKAAREPRYHYDGCA